MTDLGASRLICVNPDEGLPKQNCYVMRFDNTAQRLVCSLKAHFCCRGNQTVRLQSRALSSAGCTRIVLFRDVDVFPAPSRHCPAIVAVRSSVTEPALFSRSQHGIWISPRALFMNCQQVGHLNKQSSLLLSHRGPPEQLTAPAVATCERHANWLQGAAVTARDAHIGPQLNALSLTVTRTCCTVAIGNVELLLELIATDTEWFHRAFSGFKSTPAMEASHLLCLCVRKFKTSCYFTSEGLK